MEIRHDVHVKVTSEARWGLFADVVAWSSWTPTMTEITPLDAGDLRLAARFAIIQPNPASGVVGH